MAENEKVYFNIDPSEWHGRPSEGLWAEKVEGDDDNYKLLNSPFFVRGVSYLDVVKTVPVWDGGGRQFAGVARSGGHSTYMIISPDEASFRPLWKKLEALRCTYESMKIQLSVGPRHLYSVDVPPSSDIYSVYRILELGEKEGVWIFQEGHVGHTLPKS